MKEVSKETNDEIRRMTEMEKIKEAK